MSPWDTSAAAPGPDAAWMDASAAAAVFDRELEALMLEVAKIDMQMANKPSKAPAAADSAIADGGTDAIAAASSEALQNVDAPLQAAGTDSGSRSLLDDWFEGPRSDGAFGGSESSVTPEAAGEAGVAVAGRRSSIGYEPPQLREQGIRQAGTERALNANVKANVLKHCEKGRRSWQAFLAGPASSDDLSSASEEDLTREADAPGTADGKTESDEVSSLPSWLFGQRVKFGFKPKATAGSAPEKAKPKPERSRSVGTSTTSLVKEAHSSTAAAEGSEGPSPDAAGLCKQGVSAPAAAGTNDHPNSCHDPTQDFQTRRREATPELLQDYQLPQISPVMEASQLNFPPIHMLQEANLSDQWSCTSQMSAETPGASPASDLLEKRMDRGGGPFQVQYAIVDTNIFLDPEEVAALEAIVAWGLHGVTPISSPESLSGNFRQSAGLLAEEKIRLLLPKAVIQELDSMKRLDEQKGHLARKTLRFLMQAERAQAPWLRCQCYGETVSLDGINKSPVRADYSADDLILACGLYYSRSVCSGRVILLTSDVALQLKSLGEGIQALKATELVTQRDWHASRMQHDKGGHNGLRECPWWPQS
eukprot:SM000050S17060  [mRNA]  locus=s50:587887:590215:- [translate_table: standard]